MRGFHNELPQSTIPTCNYQRRFAETLHSWQKLKANLVPGALYSLIVSSGRDNFRRVPPGVGFAERGCLNSNPGAYMLYHKLQYLAIALLIEGNAAGQNWHSVGPPGIPWSLCEGRSSIVVGTQQAGIARSTDRGLTWNFVTLVPPSPTTLGNLPSLIVSCVVHDPVNPDTMYAGIGPDETATGFGIMKSTDGGTTWTTENAGLPRWSAVRDIAINPLNTQELYIFDAVAPGGGIYHSTNGGDSWSMFFGGSYAYRTLMCSPTDSSTWYMVSVDGTVHCWVHGVHSSIPSPTNFYVTGNAVATLLNPIDTSLYYVHASNLYRTKRDGIWISLLDSIQAGGRTIRYFCHAAIDQRSGTILVSTDSGVFRSTNDGGAWAMVSACADMDIAIDSTEMLIAGPSGMFSSADGGKTWGRFTDGPYTSRLYDMSMANTPSGDYLYAAAYNYYTSAQSLYRSTNGGSSWLQLYLPNNASATAIKANPLNPNTVYAGSGDLYGTVFGFFKSQDAGNTWKQMLPASSQPVTAIEITKQDTNRILIGAPGQVWESTDAGVPWQTLLVYDAETYAVKTSETHPSTIVVAGSTNDVALGGIFVTTDDGYHWTQSIDGFATAAAISQTNDSVVFFGSNLSMGRSIDLGMTWQPCNFETIVYSGYVYDIQVAPDDPMTVVSSVRGQTLATGGLFLSTNGGTAWNRLAFPGLSDSSTTRVIFEPIGGKYRLHVGTLSYGWYVGEIPRTVAAVDRVEGLPASTQLFQNYPNPFNPSTTIRYSLARKEHVTIALYNSLGQLVATIIDQIAEAGSHTVSVNASSFASGVYFCKMQAGSYSHFVKLLLIK